MKQRFKSRPAPFASAIAAVVGGFMLFCAFAVIPIKDAPGPVMIFVVVWFVALIGIIIYHIVNATRSGGVPTVIIETEEDKTPSVTAASRLQELENLHSQKLISDAEFEAKRQEILREF